MKDNEVLAEATFHGRIGKVGNSKMVIVPQTIIKDMKLTEGDMIVISIRRAKTERIEAGEVKH